MKNNTVAELNTDINDVAEELAYIAGINPSESSTQSTLRHKKIDMVLSYDQVMHLLSYYTRQSKTDTGRYVTLFPHPYYYKTLNPAIAALRIESECYSFLHNGESINPADRYYCRVGQYEKKNSHRVPVLMIYRSYMDNTNARGFFSIFENPAAHDLVVRSFPWDKIS